MGQKSLPGGLQEITSAAGVNSLKNLAPRKFITLVPQQEWN